MMSSFVSVIEASSMRKDWRLSQPSGCINALGYSSTGELLAAAGDDMGVHVWAAGMQHQYRCRLETCHGGNVFGVEFAPGREDLVATCAADSTINLLTLERPHCATVRQISCHTNMVNSICFPFYSPAILCSVGADGKCFVTDLRCPLSAGTSSAMASSLVVDFKCSLTDVDASPQHGNLLAVAGRNPTAFVVDLRCATAGGSAAGLSAASAPAAGASHDLPRCCVAELWCGFETGASESSTTNRLALQPAMLRAHTTGIRWSPDGAFVAACSIKGGVRVFADPTAPGLGLHHPDASHGHLLEVPWSTACKPELVPSDHRPADTTAITVTHSEPAISPAWLKASRQDMIDCLSLGGHELGTEAPGMRLAPDLAPGYYGAPPTPSDGAGAGPPLPAPSRRPMPQFSRIERRGLMAWNIEFLQRQMGSAQARYDSSTGRALRARRAASRWGQGASSGGRPASACVLASGALHSRTKKGLEWVGGRSSAVAMGSSTGHVFIWDIRGALQRNMADRQAAHRRDNETRGAGGTGLPMDSHEGALGASSVPGVSPGDGGAGGGLGANAGADAGSDDDSRPEAVMFAAAARLGLRDAERDCGRARLIGCFRADRTIANVVRARPGSRGLELAVSGLDHAVGVWSPGQEKWPPINRSPGLSWHSRPRSALACGRVPRGGGALQPSYLAPRLTRAGGSMLEVDRPVAVAHHCATVLAEGMHVLSRVAKRLAESSMRASASESTQASNGAEADPGSIQDRDGETGPSSSSRDADGNLYLLDGSIDWGSAKVEASEILRLAVALEARSSPRQQPGCQSVATTPTSAERQAASKLSSQPSVHGHLSVGPSGDQECAPEEHLSSLGQRSYRLATYLVELTADAGDAPAHPQAPYKKTARVSGRYCSVQGDGGYDEVAGMLGQQVRYESLTARGVFLLCWSSERRSRGLPQLTDGMDEDVVGWAREQARRERQAREAAREDGLARGLVRRFLQNARRRRREADGAQEGADAGAARPAGSGAGARIASEVDAARPEGVAAGPAGIGTRGPDEAEPLLSRNVIATGSQPQLTQEQMVEVVRMRMVESLMLRRRRARRAEANGSTADISGSAAAPEQGSDDGRDGDDGPDGDDGHDGDDGRSSDDGHEGSGGDGGTGNSSPEDNKVEDCTGT